MRAARPATRLALTAAWLLGMLAAEASTLVDRWDIYHPLDEGLWTGQQDGRKTVVDELEEEDVVVEDRLKNLRNVLRMAEIDSMRLFSKTPMPSDVMDPMNYAIFQTGQSALRSLSKKDRRLVLPHKLFGIERKHCRMAHYRVCACLLLLRGHSDAAHEVLLGVTLDNLEQGEYAASHRGQTNWAEEHPLSDGADILHAAMHRIVEGHDLGEGDQTGYENANYWLAGGPKLLDCPTPHPVREALARIARVHAPICVAQGGVIAQDNAKYTVPSGKGETRMVSITCGQWDDYAFLELCKQWADGSLEKDLEDEVATLQRARSYFY